MHWPKAGPRPDVRPTNRCPTNHLRWPNVGPATTKSRMHIGAASGSIGWRPSPMLVFRRKSNAFHWPTNEPQHEANVPSTGPALAQCINVCLISGISQKVGPRLGQRVLGLLFTLGKANANGWPDAGPMYVIHNLPTLAQGRANVCNP